MQAGVPVEGICLYPVLDYPGWADERHCPVGLLGFADESGRRCVHRGWPMSCACNRRASASRIRSRNSPQ